MKIAELAHGPKIITHQAIAADSAPSTIAHSTSVGLPERFAKQMRNSTSLHSTTTHHKGSTRSFVTLGDGLADAVGVIKSCVGGVARKNWGLA